MTLCAKNKNQQVVEGVLVEGTRDHFKLAQVFYDAFILR